MSRPLSRFLSIDLSGAACLLAVAGAVGVLGIHPITRLRQEQTARSARLDAMQSEADAVLSEIRSLQQDLAETTRRTEARRHTLLGPKELNVRIAGVIESAGANGLEVLALEPGELSLGEMYGRTPIRIGLRGPLPDMVRYLHEMRRDSPDLVVKELDIRSDQAGGVVAIIRTDWLSRAR